MANEIIHADDFLKRLKKIVCDVNQTHGDLVVKQGYSISVIEEVLKQIKTVDAAEVVRCKDCRKCRIYDDVITRQKQYECRLWHGATREVSADSFCDAGERREGE